MSNVTESSLEDAMASAGYAFDSDSTRLESAHLCLKFGISALDFVTKWDAHAITVNVKPQRLSASALRGLATYIEDGAKKSTKNASRELTSVAYDANSFGFADFDEFSNMGFGDSGSSSSSSSNSMDSPGGIFGGRQQSPSSRADMSEAPSAHSTQMSTPSIGRHRSAFDASQLSALKQSPPTGKYAQRADSGKIMNSLSVPSSSRYPRVKPDPDAKSHVGSTPLPVCVLRVDVPRGGPAAMLHSEDRPFRYMGWDVRRRADVMLRRIHNIKNAVIASQSFANARSKTSGVRLKAEKPGEEAEEEESDDEVEFSDLNIMSNSGKAVLIAGRIADEDDTSTKFTPSSMVLVGDNETPGRIRIQLGHAALTHYSLFPGQVAIIRGANVTGRTFVAYDIFHDTVLPRSIPSFCVPRPLSNRASQSGEALFENTSAQLGRPLSILAAAGPYCPSDSKFPSALVDLLAKARTTKPDILLLMGPFVDSEHHAVSVAGSVTATDRIDGDYDEYFRDLMALVETELQVPGCRVLVMPSLRDIHHDAIFPQPPFESADNGSQITYLPNPALISIGGVSIAATTQDILFELGKNEIFLTKPSPSQATPNALFGQQSDVESKIKDEPTPLAPTQKPLDKRVVRLSQHLLSQQSFYPLFPPPAGSNIDPVVDPRVKDGCRLPFAPDLFFVPSKLKYFAEAVPVPPPAVVEGDSYTEGNDVVFVNPESIVKGVSGGTYASIKVLPGNEPTCHRMAVDIVKI